MTNFPWLGDRGGEYLPTPKPVWPYYNEDEKKVLEREIILQSVEKALRKHLELSIVNIRDSVKDKASVAISTIGKITGRRKMLDVSLELKGKKGTEDITFIVHLKGLKNKKWKITKITDFSIGEKWAKYRYMSLKNFLSSWNSGKDFSESLSVDENEYENFIKGISISLIETLEWNK